MQDDQRPNPANQTNAYPAGQASVRPPSQPARPSLPPQPQVRMTPPPAAARNHEGIKSMLSTLAVLLLAPVIALLLTMFVFQSYEVEGQSMETTLQNSDRLIILKVPRTLASITGHAYIPNRGDIIIFNRHGGSSFDDGSDRQLIKRVVALPGERVIVRDDKLTVINKEHPEGFSPDKTLPYGPAIKTTPGNVDLVVPEGEIFVCGDNRGNSLDSRYFGPVSASQIVGKLGLRIYPFGKTSVF